MRWKRVAWAAGLAPVLGGCHTTGPAAAPELPSGGLVAHTQAAIEHRIRADARDAWRAVRAEYPRRAFTPEFRDGFLDGYSDHLDRGGDGTPPATPPLRYTRHPRYFTPEGHLLLKDYFVGFKYGADVAAATGNRQFLTVPVLVPDGGPPPVVVEAAPAVLAPPAPLPAAPATPVPPMPPASPVPPSDRPAPLPAPRALPAPTSARPLAPALVGSAASKFDYGTGVLPAGPVAPAALPTPRLPAPPASVPTLPAHVPTPPLTDDDWPRFAPTHDRPPPLPANHPDPMR